MYLYDKSLKNDCLIKALMVFLTKNEKVQPISRFFYEGASIFCNLSRVVIKTDLIIFYKYHEGIHFYNLNTKHNNNLFKSKCIFFCEKLEINFIFYMFIQKLFLFKPKSLN